MGQSYKSSFHSPVIGPASASSARFWEQRPEKQVAKNKMSTGCQDSSLGLSCAHPKVCTCFGHYWGKTTMECSRWESKELFWKRLRWRVKELLQRMGHRMELVITWYNHSDPIHLLEVCSVTQFTSRMCAMLWHWVWRLGEDSAYIMTLFLLKRLTKISMGLWEFKLLVMGNQVKVWIWLEPMFFKWCIKLERDTFMLWDTVFGTS